VQHVLGIRNNAYDILNCILHVSEVNGYGLDERDSTSVTDTSSFWSSLTAQISYGTHPMATGVSNGDRDATA
jgi:hypothetical protein